MKPTQLLFIDRADHLYLGSTREAEACYLEEFAQTDYNIEQEVGMDIECRFRHFAQGCLQVKVCRMLEIEPRILWTVVEHPSLATAINP